MQIVIDIPEGLKKDFELEQWTALSCMEMKNALEKATPLPKGHGRLIDADELKSHKYHDNKACENAVAVYWIDNAPTVLEGV